MRALVGWCVRHRRVVVGVWLLAVVLIVGVSRSAGSDFSNSFSLPGTGSTAAADLLAAVSPKVSGDVDQVVFKTSGTRSVTDPDVRARVEGMLARLTRVPHVSRVVSPYTPGAADQISPGGRVAYATVTFDRQSFDLTAAVSKRFVSTARSVNGAGLTVAVGGQVAEGADRRSLGSVGIGLLAAVVVLALVFSSLFATLLPLVTAIPSVGTAVGIVGLLSHVMSVPQFSVQLMTLIGLGVGIDYALFIVSRHRQGLRAGADVDSSIVTAVDTSGRAVLFAGIIVCIAVLGMFALGVAFLYGVALATAIGVALTMLASLTLLPALLGFLGPRVLSRRQRARIAADPRPTRSTGSWFRWGRLLARRPVIPAIAGLGVVVVLTIPFFSMRLGSSDQGNDPPTSTTRQAYDLLADGFGPGSNGPLALVTVVRNPGQRAALGRLVADLGTQAGVGRVGQPQLTPARGGGQVALVTVYPSTSPQDAATTALVNRLRDTIVPGAMAGSGAQVYVGGATAVFVDFGQVISSKLPLFIGIIVALSFLVLALVFRSLLIPLTAAVMNLLSVGAALGILVAVFQWNWLGPLIGSGRPGPVDSFLPVVLFAILFGLSMDYQVFLLTRTHELWTRTRDNLTAVREGIGVTGRIITSAALIMIVVFGSFALGDNRVIKEFGLGLAGGVLVDAMVIRSTAVPALMLLFGRANWWFPRRLNRALPRIHVEPPPTADQTVSSAPAGAGNLTR